METSNSRGSFAPWLGRRRYGERWWWHWQQRRGQPSRLRPCMLMMSARNTR
jgi:hypothetical protein